MKIRPVGAKQGSMRTNRYDKAKCHFRHFAKAPKNRTNERPFLKTDYSPPPQALTHAEREGSKLLRLYQTKCHSV